MPPKLNFMHAAHIKMKVLPSFFVTYVTDRFFSHMDENLPFFNKNSNFAKMNEKTEESAPNTNENHTGFFFFYYFHITCDILWSRGILTKKKNCNEHRLILQNFCL